MAWRAETPCGAFGFGHCGWNGLLSSVTNANGLVAEYAYDVMDRVTNIAWRTTAGASLGGFAYEATGLVTNKVYADGKGPKYDYTPDGKLSQRVWARGVATTYSYDANGRLAETSYSDGTPSVRLAYNRAGRQTRAEDAAGVTTFAYDAFGAVVNETVVGPAGENTIVRHWDAYGALRAIL
jgi:YD repeat-containing protein